jgi:small subunit ribosomal protein SAe
MSGGHEPFKLREEDVMKLLACQTHIGSANVDFQMKHYTHSRRFDGTYIIDIKKTWEKLLLAARAIAAVENPADVVVVSARPYAQRALLKFAAHTGATAIFGRFSPGCLTNQIQKSFKEPRLLVISDPRVDHQAVTEASYVNVPVISFANTESPLKLIDIAIPCNNKGEKSIGLMWWLLAREILILKGKISRQTGFVLDGKEIMPDLYFYRDPQETEKEEGGDILLPRDEPMVTADQPIDFTQAVDVQNWADEPTSWGGNDKAPVGTQDWGVSAGGASQW